MPRIVYLHGFASGPASQKASFFRARIPQLEVPDLASGDFEHLTITGQLKVIENLAAGDPVTLLGSSLGGYLAALYASRHPEVTRLVLLAPALGFARRWAQSISVEEWRRNERLKLVLFTTRATTSYLDHRYGDDVLLFGRESSGVPDEVHQAADTQLTIPMRRGLRSLNVAMACAMAVGEALRQTTGDGRI